jgi:hypothetical protein
MTRNPFKAGNVSRNSADIGTVTRKTVLGHAEELAIINGDWLHHVSASDFAQARLQLMGEPDQTLQATRATSSVDSRLV